MKWTTMNQQIGLNGQYKSVRQKWANLLPLIFTAHWTAFLFCFLMHLSCRRQVFWLSFWGRLHWPQTTPGMTGMVIWHTQLSFRPSDMIFWWLRESDRNASKVFYSIHEIIEGTFMREMEINIAVWFNLGEPPYL